MQVFIVSEQEQSKFRGVLPLPLLPAFEAGDLLVIAATGDEGRLLGILTADVSMDIWEMVYIYVEEDCRRQGVGSMMVDLLRQAGLAAYAQRIEADIIRRSDDLEAADLFFESVNAPAGRIREVYRAPLAAVYKSISKLKRSVKSIHSLSGLPGYIWYKLRDNIIRYGGYSLARHEKNGDAVYLDIGDKSDYDGDLSYIYVDEKGEPMGAILMSSHAGDVYVDYLCMLESKKAASRRALMGLLVSAVESAQRELGESAYVYANTDNKLSKSMFLRLGGDDIKIYAKNITRELL